MLVETTLTMPNFFQWNTDHLIKSITEKIPEKLMYKNREGNYLTKICMCIHNIYFNI